MGLIVNGANSIDSETFTLKLQISENFVMPDDKGKFDLNIDVSGSRGDTAVTISIAKTNLPNNLKFYIDEEYTTELITKSYKIEKSNDMTLSIPIYWYWNGKVSDENDSLFINKEISAEINVSATMAKKLYETLLSKDFTLDTNVDFTLVTSGNGSFSNPYRVS